MNTQPINNSYEITYDIMQMLSEEIEQNEGRIDTEFEDGDIVVLFEGWYDVARTTAKGTLREVSHLIKGNGSDTPSTLRYFDVDAQAFRSFRIENLITVY